MQGLVGRRRKSRLLRIHEIVDSRLKKLAADLIQSQTSLQQIAVLRHRPSDVRCCRRLMIESHKATQGLQSLLEHRLAVHTMPRQSPPKCEYRSLVTDAILDSLGRKKPPRIAPSSTSAQTVFRTSAMSAIRQCSPRAGNEAGVDLACLLFFEYDGTPTSWNRDHLPSLTIPSASLSPRTLSAIKNGLWVTCSGLWNVPQ